MGINGISAITPKDVMVISIKVLKKCCKKCSKEVKE